MINAAQRPEGHRSENTAGTSTASLLLPPAARTTAIFASHVLVREAGEQTVLTDRWIVTEGSVIVDVSRHRPPSADLVHDRPGRFVLPGLMNLHNHCFSEAVARTHTEDGAARRGNESIVYTVLLPLTKRGIDILSHEERLAIARLGILQLLKGGSATVMEPFRAGMAEMFEAALEMGIRFYGAPYLFSRGDSRAGADGRVAYASLEADGDDGSADLAHWNRLHGQWHGQDDGRIRLAMSPHATDTCKPALLQEAFSRARDFGVPITMHLAQSDEEVLEIGARHGLTPAELLDSLGLLGPDLIAAHCTASSDSDLRLMAARGTTVANCPRVFARAGEAAAYSRFVKFGLRTVIATDGYNMDLLGELNAAAMISKITERRADVATARQLLDAVTCDAAAAIGRSDLGEIKIGARADLTVVDLTHPHLQPLSDPRRALVSLANRANIDLVMVDGRVLVEGGSCVAIDEDAVVRAAAAAIHKIWDHPEARAAFNA